jgi:hypothetical protein
MISKALNGNLSIYKIMGNTTFGFAIPVKEAFNPKQFTISEN